MNLKIFRTIFLIFALLFVFGMQKGYGCGATPSDANFSVDNTTPVVNETITFTDQSAENDYTINAWNWNFGSGAMPAGATGFGPHSVYYNTIGLKTVTLTITYGNNYQDTETKTNYINVQDESTYTNPGTENIIIPDCATGVIVQAWGAGGGGTIASQDYGAGGGGGGAYTRGTITGLTPGNTISVTIGAGGAAGVGGGYSSVSYGSNTITANGGSSNQNSVNGGLGGAAQTVDGIIITSSRAGGNGGNGSTSNGQPGGGGGGSSASSTNNGANGGAGGNNSIGAGGVIGGDGGNGGNGGASGNYSAPQAGLLPGGGGGGRGKYNNNNKIVSARGANGQVLLEWIYSNLTPAVSIAITSGTNPSCSGASVTFTATPTNGGSTPTYQWYEGSNPISGATNSTYTSSTLSNGSIITCVMTSNLACASQSNATSNSIVMTVNPLATVSVGGALSAICQGGTTAALGGSFGGGATGAVWSDGSAGGTFANNDGTTPAATTYTASSTYSSPVTLTLTSSGGSCGTASGSKQLTVNPTPVITSPSTINICSGESTNISLTATTSSTFSWSIGTIAGTFENPQPVGGTGSSIGQTLSIPNNATTGSVEYIVTPTSTSGSCVGAPFTITVTVEHPAIGSFE